MDEKEYIKIIAGILIGSIAAFYIGALINFFPFIIIDDIYINAIAFCTLIICGVIAVCTCIILSKINKK